MNPHSIGAMLIQIGAMQHTSIDVYAYAYQRRIIPWYSEFRRHGSISGTAKTVHFFASHTACFCR